MYITTLPYHRNHFINRRATKNNYTCQKSLSSYSNSLYKDGQDFLDILYVIKARLFVRIPSFLSPPAILPRVNNEQGTG